MNNVGAINSHTLLTNNLNKRKMLKKNCGYKTGINSKENLVGYMSKTTHLKVVLLSLAHSMFKLTKEMISKEQSILKAKIECD